MQQSPLTAKGKECKLCKAQGGLCHLHSRVAKTPRKDSKTWKKLYAKEKKRYVEGWREKHGGQWWAPTQKDIPYLPFEEWLEGKKDVKTPEKKTKAYSDVSDMLGTFTKRTSSPKRSSSPKKELPVNFDKFKELPKPALQEVLLNIKSRKELTEICIFSEEARKICNLPLFRKEYDLRHPPQNIAQDFKLIKIVDDDDGDVHLLIYKNNRGITMEIGYENIPEDDIDNEVVNPRRYVSSIIFGSVSKEFKGFLFDISKNEDRKIYSYVGFDDGELSEEDAKIFIKEIGGDAAWLKGATSEYDPRYHDGRTYDLTTTTTKKIWKEISKHINLTKTFQEMKEKYSK